MIMVINYEKQHGQASCSAKMMMIDGLHQSSQTIQRLWDKVRLPNRVAMVNFRHFIQFERSSFSVHSFFLPLLYPSFLYTPFVLPLLCLSYPSPRPPCEIPHVPPHARVDGDDFWFQLFNVALINLSVTVAVQVLFFAILRQCGVVACVTVLSLSKSFSGTANLSCTRELYILIT